MNSMKFTHTSSLRGELTVPGDKSISHRSVMFGALADGLTEIHGFLQGADCLSTISCFFQNGNLDRKSGRDRSRPRTWTARADCPRLRFRLRQQRHHNTPDLRHSLAQKFDTTLTGDASIQKRPMKRIIDPLSQMGAKIESVNGNGCAPLHITGSPLHGIHYNSPVASAQAKSSILLAGLYADGETRVTEPHISRDHSERMLSAFGADIHTEGTTAILQPAKQLYGQKIQCSGRYLLRCLFIAAGLIVPDSEILIKNVGINPTRDGILARLQGDERGRRTFNVRSPPPANRPPTCSSAPVS
ncbi:MAG: 3-phosphoshikimate 1-carboxyvinyltransferase [Clostridium fessum]